MNLDKKREIMYIIFFLIVILGHYVRSYAGELDSIDDGRYTAQVTTTMPNIDGTVGSSCLGKYKVALPTGKNLDASTVIDANLYNPTQLNKDWYVVDHVGIKDSSYSGERHIVKRDSGIQWFGYDMPPYNDFMLRKNQNFSSINLKQAPVRADWHTVNGSGILFGVKLDNTPSDYNISTDSSINMSGYAYVATIDKIEIRKYSETAISNFCNGLANYEVLYSEDKTCNSQSLTINKEPNGYSFYIGKRKIDVQIEDDIHGEYIGVMVDYEEHDCDSLSTVFMFNYTVDGLNYFN